MQIAEHWTVGNTMMIQSWTYYLTADIIDIILRLKTHCYKSVRMYDAVFTCMLLHLLYFFAFVIQISIMFVFHSS